MDGNEPSQRPQENDGSPSSSNPSRRRSSFTKPFSGLRRMSSRLFPSSWSKDNMKYETLESTNNLLEGPPKLPRLPNLSKDNESKESFLTSLDRLADIPNYQSNPAPGLGYQKKSSEGLDPSPRPVPPTGSTPSFIPRYSNAPILFPSLMAPIQPGQQPTPASSAMPRSVTTGNLELRKAAIKEARSKKGNAGANYMRPTSSSIARRNSAVPSPPVAASPSTKRPSAEYPLGLKIDRASTQGPRLSSSNSSRALRAKATSDLPFRELYGTGAPVEDNKVQTASRPLRFMEEAHDALQKSKIPRPTTSLQQTAHQAVPASTDQGSEVTVIYRPEHEVVDLNEVKSPEYPVAPNLNPSEASEAGEASFHDSPGHTPLNLLGLEHMSLSPTGGLENSKLGQDALDNPFTEPQTERYDEEESSTKQGKQRERERVSVDGSHSFVTHNRQDEVMGYYDEEGYTAPTNLGKSIEYWEGDTAIRGGVRESDTNSGRNIVMRANTTSPLVFEEEEDDDPRNVSEAFSRLPTLLSFRFQYIATCTFIGDGVILQSTSYPPYQKLSIPPNLSSFPSQLILHPGLHRNAPSMVERPHSRLER